MRYKLPDNLYPYQVEDSNKMLTGKNWLVFSEMGVGKTPETLNAVEEGGFKCPLIVCPNSLRLEWKRQIEDWVGEDMTAVCTTDSYTKLGPIIRSFGNGQKYKVINYETFRNENQLEILSYIKFDVIVFDEIHKLRNPKTKLVEGSGDRFTKERKGGIWRFLDQHPEAKIIGLSGSPIMNYPNDLYVPLSVCYPDRYPRSLQHWRLFMYKYCLWSDGRYGPYIYGTRKLQELKEETSPFIIRRTKKEVLPFLPEKYYKRNLLEMLPDQRKLYEEMENELRILLDTGEPLYSTNVLSCLTRLRQINLDPKIVGVSSSSAKTDFLMDLIESTDEKLVIFSCFEKYIYLLHLLLEKVPHVMITGQVPVEKRAEEVKKFQNDDSIKLCLGTIQSMGEGITLTASSCCVITDRWWNTPTNMQSEDRLHRIGQKNAVEIIFPVVKDSVDETLDQILDRKHEASNAYYQESEVKQTIIEERIQR
jgi:SNF2 family DNA or RNA helicase